MSTSRIKALFDHASVSAEMAEKDAAELRLELRASEESIVQIVDLGLRRERSLLHFYQRLRKFRQISQAELNHAIACCAEDAVSLGKIVDNFRAKWGEHPKRRDGTLIPTD